MALDKIQIEKSFAKIEKILKKASDRPSPDTVHRLRTHVRRLEAALHALACNTRPNEGKLLHGLGRIRKQAGKVRDMDVLLRDVAMVHVKEEEDCAVQLLEHLGVERFRRARKLHKRLRREAGELRRRLRRTARRVRKQLGRRGNDSGDPAPASSEAAASALKLSLRLARPTALNHRNLHAYRIKVKELRYVLQLGEFSNHQVIVQKLGELKDAVGEWHDWSELAAIAADVLDHGRTCKLRAELQAIAERRYRHAVDLANTTRRTYFQGVKKLGVRPKRSKRRAAPASDAAIKAVASMAR